MKTVFKIRNKEQGLRNKFFLVSLILIGSFVFFLPAQAIDETATETSAVDITSSDDAVVIEPMTFTPEIDTTDETSSSEPASEEESNSELSSLDLESSSDEEVIIKTIIITTPEETGTEPEPTEETDENIDSDSADSDELITLTPTEGENKDEITIPVSLGDEDATSSADTIGVDSLNFSSESIVILSDLTSSTTSTPTLATTTINLRIETYDATLYNSEIVVEECTTNELATSTALTPYCALQQLENLNIEFANYGGDTRFLSKINNYDGSDWNWWAFFHNLNFADEAINEYPLKDDDNILFTYGIWPLKLEISSTTPELSSTTTITITEFGFDDSWQTTWLESTSSTLRINDEEIILANGIYQFNPVTTTPYEIYAEKTDFISTKAISIEVVDTITTTSTTSTEDILNNTGGTGGNSGGTIPESIEHYNLDTASAINFLSQNENSGILGSSAIYTDWSAIAFGAYNQNHQTAQNIRNYLLTDPNTLVGLNKVSDYARRAMALMSLDINPYSDTPTDYITNLVNEFDGTQFGDQNLFNDDIFAIIPLLHAGYNSQDEIIYKTIEFILSKQTNGGWGSVDLTAAAIQSLSTVTDLPGVSNALAEAKNKLKESQTNNGGFGSTPSTAWVMQAISVYNENQDNWQTDDKTPGDYLFSVQTDDGGLDKTQSLDTRIWNTSYAIPASLGKTWHDILQNFEKPNPEPDNQNSILDTTSNTTDNTTSTPTSTPQTPDSDNLTPTTATEIIVTSSTPTTSTDDIYEIEESKILLPTVQANLDHNPPIVSALSQTKQVNQDSNITIEQYSNEDLPTTITNEIKPSGQTLSPASTTTVPFSKTTKGVFAGATSMAGALGLYLGWRFLQTLV